MVTLVGCANDSDSLNCETGYVQSGSTCIIEVDEKYNIEAEKAVDTSALPYASYLKDTNPVMTIAVKGMGEIQVELFPDIAPSTVRNIIAYIEEGAYQNNTFHRVIEDFMIQGGKLDSPSCNVIGEMLGNGIVNPVSHERGVISMARVGGLYNSQTSQFFIVHEDSQFLDNEYAAFGGVIKGFNILDAIATVSTNEADAPVEEVTILDISVDTKGITYDNRVCAEDYVVPAQDFGIEPEKTIDLTQYAYYEYLNDQNPEISIRFKDFGTITVQLFPSLAKGTVDNFLLYVLDGAYDQNQIHRVVSDFVVQGGQLQNPVCEIVGEMTNNNQTNPLTHTFGVISMARKAYSYDTASSQFFIMLNNSNPLNDEYAAFGGMTSGFNILNFFNGLQRYGTQEPLFPIIIEEITVELNGYVVGERNCLE